ncbi:MAG TPA: low molecular weight protein-tyrosine-phosphatase [Chryseosolibacter sp.]|nr:low molecular weight protein-tyrosine-phosphatase [Chryseosolibacter sp.]
MKKVRVLFVCLGNICRSPLGAAILKKKVKEQGMDSWVEVDSCGTSNYHIGDNADPRTIANAKKHGVPIEHCARQLTTQDLQSFDFVFAMDRSNFQNILRLSNGKPLNNVRMMREFDSQGKGQEVPDPYHGGEKDFQEVFDILDRSTDGFLKYLKVQNKA